MSPLAREAPLVADKPPTGRAGAYVLFGWAVCAALLSAAFVVKRFAGVEAVPYADPALTQSLAALQEDSAEPLVVHVLFAQCRCSQKVAAHLLGSDRPVGVKETVLFVGQDEPVADRLRAHGFRVVPVREDEMVSRYHVTAAPMLVLLGRGKELRYAGGYTRTADAFEPQDLEIIERAQSHFVEPLPILDCPVEKTLRTRNESASAE